MFLASFGFLLLRFLFTPARIKVLTHLLDEESYGSLTLMALSISFLCLVFSFGSLEFLIRRIPGRASSYQYSTFKSVLMYFGGLYVVAAVGSALGFIFWLPQKVVFGRMDYALGAGLMILTAHILQRVYFLFGIRKYPYARLTQLLYADTYFLPLLIFIWIGTLDVSTVLMVWLGWLLIPLVISHRWVDMSRAMRAPFDQHHLRDVLLFGVPLLPMTLGDWLFQLADKMLLVGFLDVTAVANYALCINIAMIGFLAGTSILDIFSTEFFKVCNETQLDGIRKFSDEPTLRRMFTVMIRMIIVISIAATAVLCLLGRQIVLVLSNQKFVDAADIFPWAAPIPMLFLMFYIFGRVMMALNRSLRLGVATLLAAFLNIGLNCMLIPWKGEPGAALSTVISMGLLVIVIGKSIHVFEWFDWRELRLVRSISFALYCVVGFYGFAHAFPTMNLLPLGLSGCWCLAGVFLFGLIQRADMDLIADAFHK